ncbi:hypothetical protein [Micromonospora sp. NPDC050200]|uniref:hypothetical protein n=1 Tax=Micromonospora sp. NPDC050200 TaxID=3155664 RepID=UPI0033D57AEC
MTSSLPAYVVPGVEPLSSSADLSSVSYRGNQLAALPPVAAALDRFPTELIALAGPDERREEFQITRNALCAQVYLSTGDGLEWGFGFDDEVGFLVQPSRGSIPDDLLENALAAQPGIESAFHYDRESFEAKTAQVRRADGMLARWLDAILAAHRAYARHLGRDLPY